MNAAVTQPTAFRPADEHIDITRVRLTRPGGTAVVGELRAADEMLAAWTRGAQRARTLDYEVTFADGYRLCGRYRIDGGARRRPGPKPARPKPPSLSRFIRRTLDSLREAPATWPEGVTFFNVPTADLAQYRIVGY